MRAEAMKKEIIIQEKNYDYHIERENRIDQLIERQRTRGQIMVQDIDTILQDCEVEMKFKSTNCNISYNFLWASIEINIQLSKVIRDELKSHGVTFSTSARVADLKYELQRHYSNATIFKVTDVNFEFIATKVNLHMTRRLKWVLLEEPENQKKLHASDIITSCFTKKKRKVNEY